MVVPFSAFLYSIPVSCTLCLAGLKYAVGRDEIRLDTLGGGLKDKDVVDLVYV